MQYTYDSQNQLTSEAYLTYNGASYSPSKTTYEYTWDTAGNILSEKKNGTTTKTYTYGNSGWRDLLTSIKVSGRTLTFTYDAIGNPTKYYTGSIDRQGNAEVYSLTWEQGRQLSDITADDGQVRIRISYDYDADGIRTEKRVEYTTHSYVTQNGKVVRETISGDGTEEVLDFIYDESGRPFALNYSTDGGSSFTTYYYILNLQGDVVKLVNSSGTEYASYTYDAWGRILSTSGSLAYTNPLRYRGYYYDDETDFYYLQSRYYDPANRRFINADSFVSTGRGMLGCNMFAYCENNPTNNIDPQGNMAAEATVAATNWWNPIGWVAGGLLVCESVTLVLTCTDSIDSTAERFKTVVDVASHVTQYRGHCVYVLRDPKNNNIVKYVGRTIDPDRRSKEHGRSNAKKGYVMQVIATNLTLKEAVVLEQVLISTYTLQYLHNARREIAKKNLPQYKQYVSAVAEIYEGILEDNVYCLMWR